jgi:hypothetical protein
MFSTWTSLHEPFTVQFKIAVVKPVTPPTNRLQPLVHSIAPVKENGINRRKNRSRVLSNGAFVVSAKPKNVSENVLGKNR